jgi:hypothetical protein
MNDDLQQLRAEQTAIRLELDSTLILPLSVELELRAQQEDLAWRITLLELAEGIVPNGQE